MWTERRKSFEDNYKFMSEFTLSRDKINIDGCDVLKNIAKIEKHEGGILYGID
ncbi:hypothetical protein K420107F6_22730 [Lactonifactor longoviformis]